MREECAAWRATAALALALAAASSPASAQAWSFDQLARQAAVTHPAVLGRLSSSAAAESDLEGASWQRFPTPTLEVGKDYRGTRTTVFRVQQPVWSGGRITANIDAARSRWHAAQQAVEEMRQDILLRVIAGYAEAVRQQGRQAGVLRGIEQHQRLLDLITRRVAQEASPRVDQELAQSRLYQARNDLSASAQALAIALAQLSQLTGSTVPAVAPLDDRPMALPRSRLMALDEALGWSYQLRRLAHEEEAAQAEVAAKRAAYMPQISVRYENGYASAPLNGLPAYPSSRVLLVAEAQTGAGLSAVSGVRSAAARQDAVREQRAAAVRDIQERVSADWEEWTAAQNRLDNALRASTSAREVFDSYTRQYSAGRKTWLDVLNAVREATLSDVAVTEARAQVVAAQLRLALLTGHLTGMIQ